MFYAACMFYGTAFMYNHAILCIFSPILEVEINIVIIINAIKLQHLTQIDIKYDQTNNHFFQLIIFPLLRLVTRYMFSLQCDKTPTIIRFTSILHCHMVSIIQSK